MRLSEERIEFIGKQIMSELLTRKLIRYRGLSSQLSTKAARAIQNDLQIEDQIDAEVERTIETMKRDIPRGSAEWNSIFIQKKEELANKRNYIF